MLICGDAGVATLAVLESLAVGDAFNIVVNSLAVMRVVRIVYRLARVLDHLADPALLLQIYAETGWTREPRLRGLVEG